MMLKIAKREEKGSITPAWIIFSDILNAYWVTITGEKFKEMSKDSNAPESVREEDYPFDYTVVIGDPKKVITVEATRKNGTNLYVAFNTIGYLLNDEGKTIERL